MLACRFLTQALRAYIDQIGVPSTPYKCELSFRLLVPQTEGSCFHATILKQGPCGEPEAMRASPPNETLDF